MDGGLWRSDGTLSGGKVLKCLDAFFCTCSSSWETGVEAFSPTAGQMTGSLPLWQHESLNPWQKTSTCNNHNRKFAKSWPGRAELCVLVALVLGARLAFCADPTRLFPNGACAWALCCRRHHHYNSPVLFIFFFSSQWVCALCVVKLLGEKFEQEVELKRPHTSPPVHRLGERHLKVF